jgi:hypothetical protein
MRKKFVGGNHQKRDMPSNHQENSWVAAKNWQVLPVTLKVSVNRIPRNSTDRAGKHLSAFQWGSESA